MSRRYGRNQKRRHRAELAAAHGKLAEAQASIAILEKDGAMKQGLIDYQRVALNDLRSELHAIACEVGHQSVLLNEKTFLSGGFDGMRMEPALPPGEPIGYGQSATNYRVVTEVIRLLNAKAVRDHFRGHIQFYVDLAGKDVAYGISESAIRNLTPEFLERRIAPEIASLLVRLLKGGA